MKLPVTVKFKLDRKYYGFIGGAVIVLVLGKFKIRQPEIVLITRLNGDDRSAPSP